MAEQLDRPPSDQRAPERGGQGRVDGGPVVLVRNSNHPERETLAFPPSTIEKFMVACAVGELDGLAV
jgi:hypothetical protein